MERFHIHACVNILLIKDDSICLMRRYNTGWEDGKYEVPAGHIDGNEQITHAAAREVKEEVDIDINPKELEVVHVMHRKSNKAEKIEFFLLAKNWQGEPKIIEKDRCDDVKWFPLSHLPDNIIEKTRQGIEGYLTGKAYSEFGW